MHDVGNIVVSPRAGQARSTHAQRARTQHHALAGYRILAGSRSEVLQTGASIAWAHHERWNGSGYPRRLKGEEIALEARIAAVADVFDSLGRERVPRARFSRAEARQIVLDGRGSEFDPDVSSMHSMLFPPWPRMIQAFAQAGAASGRRTGSRCPSSPHASARCCNSPPTGCPRPPSPKRSW
jgi:putative two-component system response regulator